MKQLIPFPVQAVLVIFIVIGLYLFQTNTDMAVEYARVGDHEFNVNRNYWAAIENYEEALSFDPANTEIYFKLGTAHASYGNPDDAIAAFEQALEAGSTRPGVAYVSIGTVQYEQGLYDESRESFEAAQQFMEPHDPIYSPADYAKLYTGLGLVLLNEEGCEQAVPFFERSLQFNAADEWASRGLLACPGVTSQN